MLFLKTSNGTNFIEHHHYYYKGEVHVKTDDETKDLLNPIYFQNEKEKVCFQLHAGGKVETNYYVGTDWLIKGKKAVYVEPKLNKDSEIRQTNYLQMLFSALKYPDVSRHTKDLFEVKFDEPYIEITQHQDLLTPLLVAQFLNLVKEIVKKGLKKSYYKVEENLFSRVKGKVLVNKTIKKNWANNKQLNTYCSFEEFGIDGLENRLLKKALTFIQHYIPVSNIPYSNGYITEVFNYVNPVFISVSEGVSLYEIQHTKKNVFYTEYEEAVRLAKLILKRFGYNIANTQQFSTIKTPPFWINMSKLFELYVLGLLKNTYGHKIIYHLATYGNELDYLLVDGEDSVVIDAKYKPTYNERTWHEDLRQISGYARLEKVFKEIKHDSNSYGNMPPMLQCIIIYPDQNLSNTTTNIDLKNARSIEGYLKMGKIGIKLPELNFD